MAFFGLFGKKTVYCDRCGDKVLESDTRKLSGRVYCSACYSRQRAAMDDDRGSRRYDEDRRYEEDRRRREEEDRRRREDERRREEEDRRRREEERRRRDDDRSSVKSASLKSDHPSIQAIERAFNSAEIKFLVEHIGDQWELIAPITGEDTKYVLKFICKEKAKGDVGLRVFQLDSTTASRAREVRRVLNKIQDRYRYIRFTLDKDYDINMEFDFPSCTSNPGDIAVEMLLRVGKIIDEVYPEIHRACK